MYYHLMNETLVLNGYRFVLLQHLCLVVTMSKQWLRAAQYVKRTMILHSIPGVAAIVFLMRMIVYVKKDVSSSHMVESLNEDFNFKPLILLVQS